MNREVHVRFCEGVGVKFPRATRRAPGMARSTITRCCQPVSESELGSDLGVKVP
jgi:hypothetical protein